MINRSTTRSVSFLGLVMVLMGAWAAMVVFVGSSFGYSVDRTGTWQWNLNHAWLHLAPGAAAFFGGMLVVTALPGTFGGARAAIGSLLGVAAGAWLIVGPLAWPVLQGPGHSVFRAATPLHNLVNQVGANLGPGVLLVLMGAFVFGVTATARRVEVAVDGPTISQTRVVAA